MAEAVVCDEPILNSILSSKCRTASQNGSLPKVLIVDDENGPRQALRMLLNEDYEVLLAAEARTALQMADSTRISVVITDIRMPGLSGVELLRRLKASHPEIQVIILTGYGELETAVKAVEYGAFAYLEKPFDTGTLLQRVEAALERHSQEMERRALERLALEANRFETIGRFVSGMIHDLGTPLSVIGGHIDMLMLNPDRADLEDRLQAMKPQVHLCMELIRRTMSFLRREPDQLALFNLNDVAQSCVEVATPLLRRQQVQVTCDLDPTIALCAGDFILVRQAMLNLITNACHAMKDMATKQEIMVRTWVEGDHVCLSVGDTGPGIPPDEREKVFETFYTTKGDNGTGLGLAVVKHVMHRHCGDVQLTDNKGQGALFTLRFPLPVTGTI